MTMKKRMVLAAIAVMGAGVASAEVDMRIPKHSYLSAVVDFDAIRQEAPAVVSAVRDGITEGGRTGNIPNAATALAAIDKCKTWLGEVESGCGLCVSNVHWIVAEATNRLFWIQRDQAQTQFLWSAAVAVDGCDWKRIETYCKAKGRRWYSETVFGVRSYGISWYMQNGYLGFILGITPDGDKTYVGQASARMWAAYRGMCELDARPSRSGRLEPGEIVRVVVSDLKQVPKFIEIASSFPQNVKTVLNGMSECCFSLFLADGKIGARLVMTFKDEATAKKALKFYKAEVWGEAERKKLEERLARAREKHSRDDIEIYETLIEFGNGLHTVVKSHVLTVDTGRLDMRRFFKFVAVCGH
jgi:hypothetical protein